jgi:hypothetical protein
VSPVSAIAFAVVVWWTSNTVGHLFIHRPFFRRRTANRLFALGVSAAIGIPQTLWRDRHLAHHAGVAPRLRISGDLLMQVAFVLTVWAVMFERAPWFFATVYTPGYLGGLLLCAIHGHYEHAGGTSSHYGRLYNAMTFNDGYHVEHHAHPGAPWSRLTEHRDPQARTSAWPAPLRWIEAGVTELLERLERLVLRSPALQRFVLRVHDQALRSLIATLPPLRRVVIVGGGLFPRTALILRSLAPDAEITIVDANRENLDHANAWVADVATVHAHYPRDVRLQSDTDLVVIPLCFHGDREAIYEHPPARSVIVHDWVWRRRGRSRVVSVALLKRVNLVTLD